MKQPSVFRLVPVYIVFNWIYIYICVCVCLFALNNVPYFKKIVTCNDTPSMNESFETSEENATYVFTKRVTTTATKKVIRRRRRHHCCHHPS